MRWIKLLPFSALLLTAWCPTVVKAQGTPTPSPDVMYLGPRFDLAAGFDRINANAPPPNGCPCFGILGGFVSGAYHVNDKLALAAEFTGGHANDISSLGQNLTLITYVAGPRVTLPHGRFTPFGQILLGAAHGSDSYFPTPTGYTTSATSLAVQAGGGLDIAFRRRFAVRVPDVEFLRTSFPNGLNSYQNHIMIGAGLVMKFGSRYAAPPPPPQPPVARRDGEITFSCSAKEQVVERGEKVDIMGYAQTIPDQVDLDFAWTTNGGIIQGSGRTVVVDTTNLDPGNYRVRGFASLVSSPSTITSCEAPFRVTQATSKIVEPIEIPVPAAAPDKVEEARADAEFHDNVPDALFDYDKYDIRPDAQRAILHAAEYLKAHPLVTVLIGGYSDERGTTEYNLALGANRSKAARDALIAAGVSPDRLQIISYGKGAQVCTESDESCWQQNRRAAFMMHR